MPEREFSGRWFITAASVEDYMQICGEDIDDAAAFDRAAGRLKALCREARFVREYAGGRFESWRVRAVCAGKSRRLDLSVSTDQRGEGYSDQLVAVKDNDNRSNR